MRLLFFAFKCSVMLVKITPHTLFYFIKFTRRELHRIEYTQTFVDSILQVSYLSHF